MQVVIMQATIQAGAVVVRTIRKADQPAKMTYQKKHPRRAAQPRQARPMLIQSAFNLKAPDRYVEILNFEMEVSDVPQTKVYDLNDEEKDPS